MNSRSQVKKVNNIEYSSHLSAKSRFFFFAQKRKLLCNVWYMYYIINNIFLCEKYVKFSKIIFFWKSLFELEIAIETCQNLYFRYTRSATFVLNLKCSILSTYSSFHLSSLIQISFHDRFSSYDHEIFRF